MPTGAGRIGRDRVTGIRAHLWKAEGDQQNRDAEDAALGHLDGDPAAGRGPPFAADTSSAAEETMQRRVSEPETDKAASDLPQAAVRHIAAE